jgi:hypothetical protein
MSDDYQVKDVGQVHFVVAPGDPDAINSAATWHEDVSTQLYAHGSAVQAAAQSALTQWQGDSATAYSTLSGQVHQAFMDGHTRACYTAGVLRGISRDLDHFQQEGQRALQQAQRWIQQAEQAHAKVVALIPQVQAAQSTLQDDTSPLMTGPFGMFPSPGVAAGIAQADQAHLRDLQRRLRQAQQDLDDANREIERCDRRGQQAWEDAESVVRRFTTIPVGEITPPPLAGVPVYDVDVPQHHSWIHNLLGGAAHAITHPVPGLEEAGGWLLSASGTVVGYSGPGLTLRLVSKLTNTTIGGCVGGGYTSPLGRSVNGTFCYEQAPDGSHGFVATGGVGVGSGAGINGLVGVTASNGKTLDAQGGPFTSGGGSAGEGVEDGGGEVATGTYKGRRIVTGTAGWTPGAGSGLEGHLGETYSKVFAAK